MGISLSIAMAELGTVGPRRAKTMQNRLCDKGGNQVILNGIVNRIQSFPINIMLQKTIQQNLLCLCIAPARSIGTGPDCCPARVRTDHSLM